MPYGSRKMYRGKLTLARLRSAISRVSGKGRQVAKKAYGHVRSLKYQTKVPFAKRLGSKLQIDRPMMSRGFFPATLFTQHRYSDVIQLLADNTTGRTGAERAFRLNSLFDPDYTSTGHQPLGFDQMALLYNNYCVYKVDVQIRLVEKATSGGKAFFVCNRRASTSAYDLAFLKSAAELQEQPGNTIIDAEDSVNWNDTIMIADVEGKPRSAVFTENSYTGASNANPVETPYFSMACGTYDEPGSESSWVRVMISFVFHTRWSNPKPQAQS